MVNKICVGVYGTSQPVKDALVKINPSHVLIMAPRVDVSFFVWLRTTFPNIFIILRFWRHETNQPLTIAGAGAYADEVVKFAKACRRADPRHTIPFLQRGVDAVTGYNEVSKDQTDEYDLWQVEYAAIVQARMGIPVVGFNYGVGCPHVADEYNPYDGFNDEIVQATSSQWVKYLGMHLYSATANNGQENEAIDGPNRDWYAFRFHKVLKAWQAARGVQPPKLFVTEAGSNLPWRQWNQKQPGLKWTDDEYFRQLVTLQRELDTVGGVMFVFGLFDNFEWWSFNLINVNNPQDTRIIDLIADYNTKVK